ncbi:MAG: tRNA pseudouridine(38-40) synthase TruA [Bacteroidetes bacterium]|nr:tRNA pseudouridine(38-40) synthase TruA [Bacteroidota bacterium]
MKIALLVEYDGSAFNGWQVQPDGRTVQGALQDTLARLSGNETIVIGAGRTDAGVHAVGMVAHADVNVSAEMPSWKLLEALNALTDEDIVVRDARVVSEDFHARYSAVERSYEYRIARRRIAVGRNYAWQVWQQLDESAMQAAVAMLVGEHDFTSFSKLSDDVNHYRCTVTQAALVNSGDMLTIALSANRFVRGMVRALVGATVEIGKGKLSIEAFRRLIDEPQELHRAKFICPAHGLTFMRVSYPDSFGLW